MKKAGLIALIIMVCSVSVLTLSSYKELTDQEKKATEWVQSLNLSDNEKEARVIEIVATHLTSIRTWHNEHPVSTVPAGINPRTGEKLTDLDRQIIADSAMPKEVHENLLNGLIADLTEEQVEAILDKYTIGKVAFTMKAYREIVPNITAEEDSTVLSYLKEAREMAVDYKNMKEISAIFEIYKTKSENYFNSNGRNWRQMYKDYVKRIREEKKKK